MILSKYPEGIPSEQYFVLPGFNHVTRNQPVVVFGEDGEYKLSTVNKF